MTEYRRMAAGQAPGSEQVFEFHSRVPRWMADRPCPGFHDLPPPDGTMATDADDSTRLDDPYPALLDRVQRLTYLMDARGVLWWDQQVTMPDGGTPARSKQMSAISETHHELLTDPELGDLLDACESADGSPDAALDGRADALDDDRTDSNDEDHPDAADHAHAHDDRAAVVREIRRRHDRATSVPGDLVARHAEASSDAQQTWQDAKAEADWEAFAPTLEELKEIRVERATHVDPDGDVYATLYEDGMPTLPLETVERVFADLKEGLVPLIEEIRADGDELARPFAGQTFPEDEQAALNEAAADFLGYDRERGRLDTSPHPFTSGNQFDARITTRYDEEAPLDALTATIHEYGHATYQLGLPQDHYGSPLGSARGEVHESQSRFWENHVGRTRAFWAEFLPTFKAHLSGVEDLTVDEVYQAANRIYPENCIRVQADELTYHMHIILRHEIEQEYLAGDVAVEQLPARWNELMDEYLGVRPADAAEGPLQDIHWTGRFGGFPTYTVGSVLAAQLTAAMEADLDVEGCIRDRAFDTLREWMTEHVHRHGQRYPADELIEVATGEPLTADYFLEYANEKFGSLYGL